MGKSIKINDIGLAAVRMDLTSKVYSEALSRKYNTKSAEDLYDQGFKDARQIIELALNK